ncbi:hypothetical protein V502_01547 [Pseudogymnoascus sp. VKM F-4520 (FW-2644)]|nr:hypothetical protein V502_01547 [Pseudogymnoascus sp. VKM F-4520 (FW-2644)]
MKFFSVATIAVLATAASAQYAPPQPQQYAPSQQYQQSQQYQNWAPAPIQNKYSPAEAAAWHKCVDGFLDGFNTGHEGTKATCAFWTCLENTANQYSRGGALAAVGGAVNKACALSGLLPGHWF